jgi:hypothetical protein
MRSTTIAALSLGTLMLAGCAMTPLGPTVRVMPGPYKPFEVFQRDQYECTQYADGQVAGQADAANGRAVGATIIGAGLGLALGAATGDGNAATAGAVAGGAVGATVGAAGSDEANYPIQRRYDIAYAQCMYSKGNQVTGYARPRSLPPPPPPGRDGPPPPPRRG